MPKMKTHSGAKKRFRTTGSGKVVHRTAGIAHFRAHKPRKRLRRVDSFGVLNGGDDKKVRKLLRK
jgi:large subunit ribosomal protein L35